MKIITKEFWEELNSLYEIDVEYFKHWVDQYKKDVDWESLYCPTSRVTRFTYPKYHDLPSAMQFGIFLQYVSSKGDQKEVKFPLTEKVMADYISSFFFQKHYNARRIQLGLKQMLE